MKAHEQQAELRRLKQRAAAQLAGVSPRALRDSGCPQQSDGTYDAKTVAEWAASRQQRPQLTTEETEKLLNAADLACPDDYPERLALLDLLRNLERRAGDSGLAMFAVAWREWWGDPIERRRSSVAAGPTELDVGRVCWRCERVRRGFRWIKAPRPERYVEDQCDGCRAEADR